MSLEVRKSLTKPLATIVLQLLFLLQGLKEVLLQLDEDLGPGSVSVYVGCFTERKDLSKESIYSRIPQTCIEICEVKSYEYAILSGDKCFCSKVFHEEDRQDDRLCTTRCVADKAQYCGGIGFQSYYSTAWNKQLSVYNVKVINITENSLIIEWQSANEQRMYINDDAGGVKTQIDYFLIKTAVLHTYSLFPVFPQPNFVVQKGQRYFELTNLAPGTKYNITIEAFCENVICAIDSIVGSTLIGTPSPKPKPPRVLSRTEKTVDIEIDPIENNNGPINKILIIVEKVDAVLSQEFDSNLLGNWEKSQETGVAFYITAEIDYNRSSEPLKFTVGDGKIYGSYLNVPLNQDVEDPKKEKTKPDIHISLGVVSSMDGVTKVLYSQGGHDQHYDMLDDFVYATFDKGQQSVIALAVTCIVFGIIVVLCSIIYFYLRCSKLKQTNSLTYNQEMNEINN